MFKVYSGYVDIANGTSRVGDMQAIPRDLILAFGKPGESDGYKVSGEYTFHDEQSGAVFTLYDWKSTDLYDSELDSPETLWSISKYPIIFNIGGNGKGNVDEFINLVKQQIAWVKTGKAFEQEVIGEANPVGLFLTGNIDE